MIRSLFSYYGSKANIVRYYPKPQYNTIIEPFAGGATYSLRYPDKQVILCELNPKTFILWDYLVSTPLDEIISNVPTNVKSGDNLIDIIPKDASDGLVELLKCQANKGTAGTQNTHTVSPFGATGWHLIIQRVKYFHPKIQHWKIIQGSYKDLINAEATWFIDPPYDNSAGMRYTYGPRQINYPSLGTWCKSRKGQIIVCENKGATWLPFTPIRIGHSQSHQSKKATEMIWTNRQIGFGLTQ